MTELEYAICTIRRWLWFTEVNFENVLTDSLNNFSKFRKHTPYDYLDLYSHELDFRNFQRFSRDLEKLLDLLEKR